MMEKKSIEIDGIKYWQKLIADDQINKIKERDQEIEEQMKANKRLER